MRDKPNEPTGETFSDLEEEFFRAGDSLGSRPIESFADLDAGYQPRPGLVARLFGKRLAKPRAATERPIEIDPPRRRAPTRPPSEGEDEWDWAIAIARARAPSEGVA